MKERSPDLTFVWSFVRSFSSDLRERTKRSNFNQIDGELHTFTHTAISRRHVDEILQTRRKIDQSSNESLLTEDTYRCTWDYRRIKKGTWFSMCMYIETEQLAHLSRRSSELFLITICPLSVVVVVGVVNFSHFLLLLQNHWTNFNHAWYKVSLGEGDSSLFKWRTTLFSKAR